MGDGSALPKAQAFRDAADLLRSGKPLPFELGEFLGAGIGQFISDLDEGEQPSLDRAFGLKQWGGVPLARQEVLKRRDELLCSLWREHPQWSQLAPIAAAKQISQEAQRYQANRWPRERNEIAAPVAEPAATFWRILDSGQVIPGSKRIQQILEREMQEGI